MSSYSEYLGRMKQRMVTITDTRPHRDAGHQTEIIRRMAASGNLETAVANTACLLPPECSLHTWFIWIQSWRWPQGYDDIPLC